MILRKSISLKSAVFVLSTAMLLGFAESSIAEVKLPAVISDNMVLQQAMQVPVWGWAEPGEEVTVTGSWQRKGWNTKADKDGKWMVGIDPPKQTAGSYEMTIKGSNTLTIKNILVGEVWICSGQSNMEMPVGRSMWFKTGVNNYQQEIEAAHYPKIRLFTVKQTTAARPQKDCSGTWAACSPETVAEFSAVAYFFGRQVHQRLNVPVALIQTCWGGTPAEAWTRREVLEADPDLRPIVDRIDKAQVDYIAAMKEYSQKLAEWLPAAAEANVKGCETPVEPAKPASPEGPKSPCRLYNGMIAPLLPYGIAGAIWYQGESNTSRAYQYRKLFPAMIENWRKDWGQGDFPFYYVQIAPFNFKPEFIAAELREAQMIALSLPNTGMAVTTDIGNINDIHPQNKQDVGRRLALWALAKTYGQKNIIFSGPLYKSMKVEGDKIRLFFDYADGGLVAKDGPLTDFTIAGEDRNFVEAAAKIDGDTIVVSSDKVKKPVAARFGWRNTAVPNLFNKAALPASSFRTDDWPGVTYNQR
jgi:sialate O-acetylesterase